MADEKEGKQKALQLAVEQIEKNFGKGSIMRLGDGVIAKVEAIPTGSISLDGALGIGGVPRGRIVEIFGPESSGKTTICLHIVAEAQRRGCHYGNAKQAQGQDFGPNCARADPFDH